MGRDTTRTRNDENVAGGLREWIDKSDDGRERNKMDLLFANAPSPPQNEVSQEGKLNENKEDTGGEGGIRTRVRILS